MCGIFGWLGSSPADSEQVFQTLSRLLKHRGPDDAGFETGPGWGLGFRRLSILDLSELGHQPMSTPDGRFWIVFNGEIYNYLELREDLEKKGERFRGTSDTEVLLRLLVCEGPRALERLNGMFALTLVDTVERKFLLARDRLGKKPLYYYQRAGQLRFASELKALLAWPNAPREINMTAVVEYLTLGYLPNETCIFQDYQKLPPGHYLTGSLDEPERANPSSYWSLELNDQISNQVLTENDLEALLDLLANAVKIRLRSDVPVGIFLSGGIDSGLITALAAQSGMDVHPLALTISFDEENFDERLLAENTAKHTGLEHRIIVQQSGGLRDIDRLGWFFDEPFGDASALPTMTLCQVASEHATVFLSGDGGDEAFGGYQRYIKAQHYAWLGKLPTTALMSIRWLSRYLPLVSPLRYRMVKSSLPDTGMAAVFDGEGLSEDPALEAVLHPNLKELTMHGSSSVWRRWALSRGKNILTRQQALDYALYLPDDILVKMDRASMANSIEVRSPLLDYRVVEWSARLSRSTLLNTKEGKLPLRAIASKLLPPAVQTGAKRGFGIPLNTWFRQFSGQDFVRERLLSSESSHRGLWDSKGVKNILDMHRTGRGRSFGELLWRLLMLDAWARHYVDSPSVVPGAS
jgi:asparagine synthase (glutamine-hydrolysing)